MLSGSPFSDLPSRDGGYCHQSLRCSSSSWLSFLGIGCYLASSASHSSLVRVYYQFNSPRFINSLKHKDCPIPASSVFLCFKRSVEMKCSLFKLLSANPMSLASASSHSCVGHVFAVVPWCIYIYIYIYIYTRRCMCVYIYIYREIYAHTYIYWAVTARRVPRRTCAPTATPRSAQLRLVRSCSAIVHTMTRYSRVE